MHNCAGRSEENKTSATNITEYHTRFDQTWRGSQLEPDNGLVSAVPTFRSVTPLSVHVTSLTGPSDSLLVPR
jgi:hypothetical protein